MRYRLISLLILVIFLMSGVAVYSAEGISVPQKSLEELSKKISASEVKQPSSQKLLKKTELEKNISQAKLKPNLAKNIQKESVKSEKKVMSFGGLLKRMATALAAIIALILGLAGLIMLFRLIRARLIPAVQGEHPAEEPLREPADVSEAVSSFVKHRLRK